MTLDVHVRHRLAVLLSDALASPGRFEAACAAAGLSPPPVRGVDPPFARVASLLLGGVDEAGLSALIEAAAAAAPGLAGDLRAAGRPEPEPEAEPPSEPEPEPAAEPAVEPEPGPEPELEPAPPGEPAAGPESGPAAEPTPDPAAAGERDEDDLATVRVLDSRQAVIDAPPRPAGTPAEAPPREGASSWLLRRVHLSVPTSVRAGEEFGVQLTLARPGGGTVPGAPEDAVAYGGAAAAVDFEFWLEEALPLKEGDQAGQILLDPAEERAEVVVRLRASEPLNEGVDIVVRFFVGGYEVGRARAFVPDGDRDDVAPRPASPGALAVPDSVIS